jgi:hypothetical protein
VRIGTSNITVHGSSFVQTATADADSRDFDEDGEALFAQENLRGTVEIRQTGDGNGYLLIAMAVTPFNGKIRERGALTVWFADELLKPLAEEIARSLAHVPPKQDR